MKPTEFYRWTECGAVLLQMCGGAKECTASGMERVSPQTGLEAAKMDKHKPITDYTETVLSVAVGGRAHPMTTEHFIQWIYVQTRYGGVFRALAPRDAPEAVFAVRKENVIGVYACCNLHGLWKADPITFAYKEFEFQETVCSAEFPEGCIEG